MNIGVCSTNPVCQPVGPRGSVCRVTLTRHRANDDDARERGGTAARRPGGRRGGHLYLPGLGDYPMHRVHEETREGGYNHSYKPRAAKRQSSRGPHIYERLGNWAASCRRIFSARVIGGKRMRRRRGRQGAQRPQREIVIVRSRAAGWPTAVAAVALVTRTRCGLAIAAWQPRQGPGVRTGEAGNPGPHARDRRKPQLVVTSGNVTGWGTGLDWLDTATSEVVCMQEHKQRTSEEVGAASTQAIAKGWKSLWAKALTADTEPGGASAGTVVLAKANVGLLEPPGGHEVYDGRVAAALVEAGSAGGVVVYSVYLVSGDELGARNWAILQSIAVHVAGHGLPWVCVGDWNVPPGVLAASGWAERLQAKIVVPPVAHTTRVGARGGRLIDYSVISNSVADLGIQVGIDGRAPIRTHDAITVTLPIAPRSFEVTRLLGPKHFPRMRPIGPRKQPPEVADLRRRAGEAVRLAENGSEEEATAALNAAVDMWFDRLEDELVHLYHIDEHGIHDEYRGRARGHKLVRAPVLGPRHRGRPRGDPAARRMRMVQDRASDLLGAAERAKSRDGPTVDLRERLRAAIDTATYVVADGTMPMECKDMAGGLKRIARRMEAAIRRRPADNVATWYGEEHAAALREVIKEASAAAEPAETRHRTAIARDVARWCAEAQANGASLAHRWTQVPVEWRPESAPEKRGVEIRNTSNPDVLVAGEADKWEPIWRPPGLESVRVDWGQIRRLARPTVHEARAAAKKFKPKTKIGVEGVNPRDLAEITDDMMEVYIDIMVTCELLGRIPERVALVIILLLNKKSGGRRPVGILPTLYRVWAAIRKPLLHAWERNWSRNFFAAGRGKSATDAAWHRALRAEHAALVGASAGSILWDLRKCFEHGRHSVLAREAEALGFPMAMARLATAVYSAERRLCLDGAMSRPVKATRGFIAGCAWAAACVRVTLQRKLEAFVARHPHVDSELYIDDAELQAVGQGKSVARDLAAAALDLAEVLNEVGYALADDKAVVITSHETVTSEIIRLTRGLAGKEQKVAEKLGVEYTAGRRRPRVGGPRRARLRKQLARKVRIARFRKLGGAARVVAARGQIPAATYGGDVNGISDAELYRLRGMMGRATAPSSRGSYTLLKLMLTEDPAVRANSNIIGRWSAVAWRNAGPQSQRKGNEPGADVLRAAMAAAISDERQNPGWDGARGPAGATVRTARRIGWEFKDAFRVVDELGCIIDFGVMDPRAVRDRVRQATDAATARQIARHEAMPQLEDGIWAAPIRSALRSARMSPAAKACLRRTFAGGYWSGARRAAAGMLGDPGCDCGAPLDDTHHRLYECPRSKPARDALLCDRHLALAQSAERGHPMWTRCLVRNPAGELPKASTAHDEYWYFADGVEDRAHALSGNIFIDGSALFPKCAPARRAGWTALDLKEDGTVRAAVYGPVPLDISPNQAASAGELHGLRRGAELACGPSRIFTDYQSAADGARRGPDLTTCHKTATASAWRGYWRAAEGAEIEVVKVAAHRTMRSVREDEDDAEALLKKRGNDAADAFAKKGAAAHHSAAQLAVLEDFALGESELRDLAVFVGSALAYWAPAPRGARTSTARGVRKREVQRRRHAAAAQYGHNIAWTRSGWRCTTCGSTTVTIAGLRRLRSSQCNGHTAGRIAEQGNAPSAHVLWAAEADDSARATGPDVVWCDRCGGYSSTKLYKLAGTCSGVADLSAQARLASLRNLRHPTLGYRLREPVRLTDPVIAQLKAAGERQRQGFARVLRDVLTRSADGGNGDDAQPRGGRAASSDGQDAPAGVVMNTPYGPMDLDDGDDDIFGHGGGLDNEEAGASAAADAPRVPECQPPLPAADSAADHPPHDVQATDPRARSEAARQRIQSLKERILARRSNSGTALPAAADEPCVHRVEEDEGATDRPTKFRRVEAPQDVGFHQRDVTPPRVTPLTGTSIDGAISDVGSLPSARRPQAQAARELLLARLAEPRNTPQNSGQRSHAASAARGGAAPRRVHEEHQPARGVKRAPSCGGDAAGGRAAPAATRRRLVGKQPPREGIG